MHGKSNKPTIPYGGVGPLKSHQWQTTGEKEYYYSKENIEAACLAEARDQFTQANDTMFLTDPLLSNLGIIRTQREEFNQIARETYGPPLGTPINAQQLLPLLQHPMEITDQPQHQTKEQHKEGWKNSKEATSSAYWECILGTAKQVPQTN